MPGYNASVAASTIVLTCDSLVGLGLWSRNRCCSRCHSDGDPLDRFWGTEPGFQARICCAASTGITFPRLLDMKDEALGRTHAHTVPRGTATNP